jgi:hypothetical protein
MSRLWPFFGFMSLVIFCVNLTASSKFFVSSDEHGAEAVLGKGGEPRIRKHC